jgi:aminopeptidase-like protein
MHRDLVNYFNGKWTFEREIVLSGAQKKYATATGNARFEQGEGNMQYEETGKVFIVEAQQQSSFFRNYRYVFTEDGLDIYFNDSLTQNFNLYQHYIYNKESNTLAAKEIHVCNKDLYEGGFRLLNESHYVHTSVIKGPQKDFFITTHYHKIPG